MSEHCSWAKTYQAGTSGSTASSLPTHISSRGRFFVDEHGRSIIPRGANLSGLSKLPTRPSGFTHLSEGFFDHEISFVGRPFPLEEADLHLSRLQQWGLTFLRLVVPWESLEHAGPGVYDYEFIEYLTELLRIMPRYGIKCYIDAHQDVWSRHTGGSGAPTWTLAIAGLDIHSLKATGAAHAHNLHLEPEDPPPKVWPSGYCKLAAATMATVFWAGDTFAPKKKVRRREYKGGLPGGLPDEEIGIQLFLQTCMAEAFGVLADHVKDLEAVMGFEVINEPHRGYIELLSPFGWDFKTDLAIGYFPSALQGWALGAGHPVLIDHYVPKFPVTGISHAVVIAPPKNCTAWLAGSSCIWEDHGVWAWDPKRGPFGEPVVLRTEYFSRHPISGKEVDWYQDFYWPFCQKFGDRITKSNPRFKTFVGPIPNEFCPLWPETLRPTNLVYAPHWYDLQALFSKALGTMSANVQGLSRGMFFLKALYFGRSGLKKNYALQIRNIINAGYRSIGELPVIIGETGVPFDLNGGAAFKTGDFSWQERQMDAICSALESNLVGFNLWNYNPLNNDEWGDSWNGENFSWFSTNDVTKEALDNAKSDDEKRNVGGRVLNAVERPYAAKIAGIPTFVKYDMSSLTYSLRFANPTTTPSSSPLSKTLSDTGSPPLVGEPILARETEIYLPRRRFGELARRGKRLIVSTSGEGEWKYSEEHQTLYFVHTNLAPAFVHRITISVEGASSGPSLTTISLLVLLLAIVFAVYLQQGRHV